MIHIEQATITIPAVYNQDGVLIEPARCIADGDPVIYCDASIEEEKAARIAGVKSRLTEIFLTQYPLWKQNNAALGIGTDKEINQTKQAIIALRSEVKRIEDLINKCTNLKELMEVEI